MSNITPISVRRKSRRPTSDIGAIVLEIAEQIVGDDKDVAAVLDWAAEKFGRAFEDNETAKQLRFALSVVICGCVKNTIVAECDKRGLTRPHSELLETLAGDVAELTAAPLANRVIRRLAAKLGGVSNY